MTRGCYFIVSLFVILFKVRLFQGIGRCTQGYLITHTAPDVARPPFGVTHIKKILAYFQIILKIRGFASAYTNNEICIGSIIVCCVCELEPLSFLFSLSLLAVQKAPIFKKFISVCGIPNNACATKPKTKPMWPSYFFPLDSAEFLCMKNYVSQ